MASRAGAVTLADVARAAGVSKMTVSRALSPDRSAALQPDTLARVRAAAGSLGYRPNLAARSLTARRSGIVAIVVPDLGNAVFAEIIAGIQAGLKDTGRETIVARTGFDPAAECDTVRHLSGWNPDAFVLAGPSRTDAVRALVRDLGIPTVEVMDLPPDPIDMAVGFPHAEAGALAAEHLHARGYRRPATLSCNAADTRAARRIEGFRARATGLGLAPPVDLFDPAEPSFGLGRALCARLRARAPAVDCVFAANDLLAVGAVLHCQDAGVAVPGALAVCGFNDLPIAAEIGGGLTTVHSPRRAIGRETAALLLDLAGGAARPVAPVRHIPCHVVPRGTT
ncbi:LacI family DNA-binding transcriptional regulator [Jannaschia sp. LMIT008]|uniref:LacI family DNA-binding transcriptional regulator n=1 Tax=Jannaschia maritima TaxID=3032585 RepID=UPI002812057E|nr:LacI family DNA-binding transcriptional regulator [Jannaschia sp. LMIT008]